MTELEAEPGILSQMWPNDVHDFCIKQSWCRILEVSFWNWCAIPILHFDLVWAWEHASNDPRISEMPIIVYLTSKSKDHIPPPCSVLPGEAWNSGGCSMMRKPSRCHVWLAWAFKTQLGQNLCAESRCDRRKKHSANANTCSKTAEIRLVKFKTFEYVRLPSRSSQSASHRVTRSSPQSHPWGRLLPSLEARATPDFSPHR